MNKTMLAALKKDKIISANLCNNLRFTTVIDIIVIMGDYKRNSKVKVKHMPSACILQICCWNLHY